MSNGLCDDIGTYLRGKGAVGGEARPPDCVRLKDLTTAGTFPNHTNAFDWGGFEPDAPPSAFRSRLHVRDAEKPKRKAPGLQIDGYFSDETSSTTLMPGNRFGKRKDDDSKAFSCDSQFVIRFPNPEHWEGRLVICGAPGNRGQYANDFIIGDHVLSRGCAFASTDKGNSGFRFYGADQQPGDAMAEWNRRIEQLTEVVKGAAKEYYGKHGKELKHTYITGCSNGGYLTRYALENDRDDLYDGGVDWQGPLWVDPAGPASDPLDLGPNLLTFLPWALKYYPDWRDNKSRAAHDAMVSAGFEPGSEFLWQYYYDYYWNLTQRIYREDFDPYYVGNDAEYNYADRINPQKNEDWAQNIRDAVKRVSLTGDIKKPLITLHGTLDALLPITKTSDKYAQLVNDAGRSDMHRYYRIEGGTHIESLYDSHPDKLRPMLPCYKAAFDRLVEWVENDTPPPGNKTIPKPEVDHIVNSCPELEQ